MNSLSDFKNVYHFGHNKLSLHLPTNFILTAIGQYMCGAAVAAAAAIAATAAVAATGHLSYLKDMTSTTNCSNPRQAYSLCDLLNAVLFGQNKLVKARK